MRVGDQQAQLVSLDDDHIAVAPPRARAHPASAGGVGEGALAYDPARAATDVLHDETTEDLAWQNPTLNKGIWSTQLLVAKATSLGGGRPAHVTNGRPLRY